MTFRSRKLLDQAHTMPCLAQFQHECTAWQGCEPAHADSQLFGRGHGHKAPDWAFASMCHTAHRMISAKVGGGMDRDTKFHEWLRAYVATQEWLWTNQKIRVAA